MKSKIIIQGFVLLLILLVQNAIAQVAVNTSGNEADASAMLDVTSTNKGVLLPRMTSTERDDIINPIQGLLVFVTTDNCFYSYDGSGWVKLLNADNTDDDWDVSGNNVTVSSSKKIGIGIAYPSNKVEIYNSSLQKSLVVENSSNNSDNNYGLYTYMHGSGSGKQYGNYTYNLNSGNNIHYGNFNKLAGSGSGIHYGSYNSLYGDGTGIQYGTYQSLLVNTEANMYANYNMIYSSGNGTHYAGYFVVSGLGSGTHYGTYTHMTYTSSGLQIGNNIFIDNSGDGVHYGLKSYIVGNGSGNKYGVYSHVSSTAGGTHYGIYSWADGDANYAAYLRGRVYIDDKIGIGTEDPTTKLSINNTDTDTSIFISTQRSSAEVYGIYNLMTGPGTGKQYAAYNKIDNSEDADHYTNYNLLTGSVNGRQYGSYQDIDVSGSGVHYGNYNKLTGSGSGNKYGSYNYIPSSAGGTHYGVFSSVSGSTNYAGYFAGKVYVSDNMGVGTTSPTVKLDVRGDFQVQNNNAAVSANIESSIGGASLSLKAAGSSDLAQVKFYNASTEQASLGFDVDNGRIFIKEGIKSIFIDNGNINPESHRTQDLGYSGKAWDDIYYDDLHAEGSSAFVGRIVTDEIMDYPPVAKLPGSFDYKTKRGDVELNPTSLPDGLHDETSILTDEVVTFNYKANYEQQVQINELKKVVEQQNKKIEQLLKLISEK